jgi:hypothetical protein
VKPVHFIRRSWAFRNSEKIMKTNQFLNRPGALSCVALNGLGILIGLFTLCCLASPAFAQVSTSPDPRAPAKQSIHVTINYLCGSRPGPGYAENQVKVWIGETQWLFNPIFVEDEPVFTWRTGPYSSSMRKGTLWPLNLTRKK